MAFESHPLRSELVSEMHLRRTPALAPPLVLIQTVRMVAPEQRDDERAYILTMPGVTAGSLKIRPRNVSGHAPDGVELIWERHSEASTTTLIAPARESSPFEVAAVEALTWLEGAPGPVIRATKVALLADEASAEALVETMTFAVMDQVSCRIGGTRIWSDFQLRDDGYGRLIVAAGNVLPADLGRTVQRLQELGNYRNLALLGLPLAQHEGVLLSELEARLETIAGRIAGASARNETEAATLDSLCGLAASAAAMSTKTGFRMSATRAYAQITHDRLQSLRSVEIAGFQSLEDFTERRMLPAVRTCASFEQRLETLSTRIERATSLLRTKVDLAMQSSNVELLRSMDANAARQLRLQHLVEGLSVIAVSYYAFSLLAKLFPLIGRWSGLSEDELQSALVLPVVVAIYFFLRWRARDVATVHP